MRILVAGSRNFEDWSKVELWLLTNFSFKEDILISGGASGPDSWAESIIDKYDGKKEIFLADWNKYGKKAGPLRNELMVKVADQVVVFWDGESRGSKSTIDYALKYQKHLEVIFND